MTKINLKKGKDDAIRRFHPWVFSGAIQSSSQSPKEGEIVEICSADGDFLGNGHYQTGSIAVRVFSFEKSPLKQIFWTEKLRNAYELRKKLGLIGNPNTDCYRLVHAEGDGFPGLVIDVYGAVAVVQCHSIGMFLSMSQIAAGLQKIYGKKLTAIYNKSHETLPDAFAATTKNGYIFGESELPVTVFENGNQFMINWVTGQKTGFFIDQRDNRSLLARYVKDKNVLNAFCYSGGFSVYALKAGAKSVHSVDVSAKAIELTEQNVALNFPNNQNHTSHTEDVLQFLKKNELPFDVMIVDPPAYAKSIDKRHNAVQGYKRLNAMALSQIAKGGILFTFSCSQVVDKLLFQNTIMAAALEAKRQVRILHHLTQPADHPTNLFHPEGSYLKGLVLLVE